MVGKKPFVNRLTRSSDTDLNVPLAPDTLSSAQPDTTAAANKSKRTKSWEEVFEETHQRFTAWVDKKLKQQFDDLAARLHRRYSTRQLWRSCTSRSANRTSGNRKQSCNVYVHVYVNIAALLIEAIKTDRS